MSFKSQALKKGDTIAIIAPASPFEKESFLRGIQRLENFGFQVIYQENIFSKHRYLAGSDERRTNELINYLKDPIIKAILIARGGYGSMRLIPYLERHEFTQAKILLGYSDFTSLLTYFYQKYNWSVFHGPCVAKDFENLKNEGWNSLINHLCKNNFDEEIIAPKAITIKSGKVSGELVGGCLSLVVAGLGTAQQLNTDNKILFLEDTGEKPYQIDRMLTQLKLAGLLKNIKGLIIGPLKDTHQDLDFVKDLLKEWLVDLEVPILFNFPSGHRDNSLTLALGIKIELDTDKKSITYLENLHE